VSIGENHPIAANDRTGTRTSSLLDDAHHGRHHRAGDANDRELFDRQPVICALCNGDRWAIFFRAADEWQESKSDSNGSCDEKNDSRSLGLHVGI
jgi:hypothetical protein